MASTFVVSLPNFADAKSKKKTTSGIYGKATIRSTAPTEDFGKQWYMPFGEIVIKSEKSRKVVKKFRANQWGNYTITVPPGDYIVTASIPAKNEKDGWTEQEAHITVWNGFYTKVDAWIDAW